MYNNPFLKKDPLLEAVQNAMQDGEIRRRAEALVNEEFGVYSRKAVVREDLAAYDEALEEVYAALKEGVQIDELKKPTPETALKVVNRANDRDEWSAKAANRLYSRYKKGYEPKEKKTEVKEDLAKKDYDRDGKIESGKDEVWGSRLRAAKLAGKLKEEEQIDELHGKGDLKKIKQYHHHQSAKALKAAAGAKWQKDVDRLNDKSDDHWNQIHRAERLQKKMDEEQMEEGRMPSSVIKHKQKLAGMTDAEKKAKFAGKSEAELKSMARRHGYGADSDVYSKHAAPKKVDEAAYSAKSARAGKDIGKPGKQFSNIAAKAAAKYGSEERGKKVAGAILKRIRAKHMKEDQSFNAALTEEPMGIVGSPGKAAQAGSQTVPLPPRRPAKVALNSVKLAPRSMQSTPAPKASGSTYFKGSPNVSKGDYTVKQGETLSGIAKRLGTSVGAIQSMNKGMTDVNKIASGAKLNLPTTTGKVSAPAASSSAVSASSTPRAAAAGSTTTSTGGSTSTQWSDAGAQERVRTSAQSASQNAGLSSGTPSLADQAKKSAEARPVTSPVSAPEPEKKKQQTNDTSVVATESLNETVQVGAYKYRIV